MLNKLLTWLLLANIVCAGSAFCQLDSNKRPPLKPGMILGELVAGTAVGILGFFTTYVVYSKIIKAHDQKSWPYQVGYGLGVTYGVIGVGNRGGETGSFLATAAGSALGTYLITADGYVSFDSVSLFVVPVFAVIGYNLTRKYSPVAVIPIYDLKNKKLAFSASVRF